MSEFAVQLEASTVPIGEISGSPQLNFGQIWDEYHDNKWELSLLRKEIELSRQEVEREREKVRELSDQWEKILHQLLQVQEELERRLNTERAQIRQINELRSEIDRESRLRLNAELRLDSLLRSFSWRITAPLRNLLSPLIGQPFNGKPIHERPAGE